MKTYKVIGPVPFLGHPTGEEFRADLPQAQEDRRVASGTIEVVNGSGKDVVVDDVDLKVEATSEPIINHTDPEVKDDVIAAVTTPENDDSSKGGKK